jgi:TolB-like protein
MFGLGFVWAEKTVAVADFTVESENPSYKYIGKGMAELIASELSKSKDIVVIDRDKRPEILSELEFAMMSGGAELQLSKLLTAQYLISGKIIDMVDSVLVTVSSVDVETGLIIWQDKLVEKLSKYSYMSAYFAGGILKALRLSVDKMTLDKVEKVR